MLNTLKKPEWLNKKVSLSACRDTQVFLKSLNLNTVCQEARCPNIGECFSQKNATFLILGDTCTRNCSFCAVKKGLPLALDYNEAEKITFAVRKLGINYVVITSVTRDDLNDGGSGLFAQVVLALRRKIANIKIEVLVPDFKGQKEAVITVVEAGPLVLAHNLETVPRLYAKIRPQADYQRSLMLLQNAKIYGKIYSKSGLMLGLGESEDEVLKVLRDLRRVNCDFLNLGQYLSPGLSNYQVQEYVTPNKFGYFKEKAIEMGFLYVASAPYVRSSYLADEYFKNKGDSK